MNMQIDEEEVVQTIPVFLSQAFAKQLFIFQYPTRPNTEDSSSHHIVKSCIKPQLQEVELEESLDTTSAQFDKRQAETFAFNADGTTSSSSSSKTPRIFPRGFMDRITLKSTKASIDPSSYAVGFLKDGELHLSPLEGIVSLRPSFAHLDKSDKRQNDEEAGEEPEEEAKQVQIKFARQENERTKRLREQSYDYHSKLIAGEPWFHTKYFTSDTEKAELARNKLLCSNRSGVSNKLSLDANEYLQYLIEIPEETSKSLEDSGVDLSKSVSRRDLRNLPLPDQVRLLLREAKVLSTRQLQSLLGPSHDLQTVIKVVQTVAVMVKGIWVVRSDILYPRDTTSALNGVPADIMCRSRDYVLSLFTRHRYVDRLKVASVLRIPPEELIEILEGLAVLRRGKGWYFRLHFDRSFAERFPDVVQRQEMWWEAKNRQLVEALKQKSQTPPSSPVKPRAPRSAGRRRDSSMSSSDGEGLTPSRHAKS